MYQTKEKIKLSNFPIYKSREAVKRALKYKQLEDDNKRLRQLLKTQLQNSENLRNETQQTVETLKEEFDLLVKVQIIIYIYIYIPGERNSK